MDLGQSCRYKHSLFFLTVDVWQEYQQDRVRSRPDVDKDNPHLHFDKVGRALPKDHNFPALGFSTKYGLEAFLKNADVVIFDDTFGFDF